MRIVTVTPAGRRRYTQVLAQYLLQHRDIIDEHHWWACTRDERDRANLFELTAQNPEFFHVNDQPYYDDRTLSSNIWKFFQDCTDPDTIYIRLDDDICYIAPDAIANLVRFRRENPDPFLVFGNIVNNAVCAYFHQRAGLISATDRLSNMCMDPVGWGSPTFARAIHRSFLRDLDRGATDRWQRIAIDHKGFQRFSINVICWMGRDMQQVPERYHTDVDEEHFLTAELPRRMGRPNVVCSEALFSHFAFWTQRDYLEWTSRDLLGQYARFVNENPGKPRSEWAWRLSDAVYRLLGAVWRAGDPIRKLRFKWQNRLVRRALRRERQAAAESTRLMLPEQEQEAHETESPESRTA